MGVVMATRTSTHLNMNWLMDWLISFAMIRFRCMAWTHILRMQYVTVKSLLDQSDFDWDENTDIIMAKDDIWDNYIKEYPDAESMGSIGCPMYKHLCMTTFWATCPLFIFLFIYLFLYLQF